ncbi:MAG: restriction endonuclease subunit S [Catenibacterium mitsuokai]|nr:restriction endonuclease subunit S [Catenibacterium mitsuokai]MBN2931020.1 restriction endonuclease subunit S [Catenibacterium mitsuokai]
MEYVKLEEICTIVSGGTPSRSKPNYWNNGNIPWIKIKDMKSKYIDSAEEFITEEGLNNSSTKMLKRDTILYSIFATLGEVGILKIDACTNQAIAGLSLKEDSNILKEYLYYYLKSKKKDVNNLGRGVAQNNINLSLLRKFKIPVIPLRQQKKIIEVLDNVSSTINNYERELALLDELVKARFVEMFGDENNSKGWEIVNIEDVVNVQVGVVIKPSQYYTDQYNGIKAFRSLNIGNGYIKDDDWVYFSKEGNKKNKKSILSTNDVLVVRSGAPGTACVVTSEYAGSNAIDVIIAHPDFQKVDSHYLCTYTNMPHGKSQIIEGTGGAAQQHFNVGKYNKLKLMLPPLEYQKQYVKFLEEIDKSRSRIQKSLEASQELFDSLMQEYFG